MRWRLILILAVALTAGCGSLFADGDGYAGATTDTLSPAPVPEVTPTPERWGLAPGLSVSGVADLDALVAAHSAATANASYVWRERRGSAPRANGSVPLFDRTVATVESPDRYYVWTSEKRVRLRTGLRHVANYSEFTAGERRTVRYRLVGQTDYRRQVRDAVAPDFNPFVGGAASDALRRYLAVRHASVSVTRIGGERHYLVVGREWTRFAGGEVTNYTATALVRSDGFVRTLDVAYTLRSAGQARRVRYQFTYERIGNTTVATPAWFDPER